MVAGIIHVAYLARIGPLLENHPIFPDRANISLAAIAAPVIDAELPVGLESGSVFRP